MLASQTAATLILAVKAQQQVVVPVVCVIRIAFYSTTAALIF